MTDQDDTSILSLEGTVMAAEDAGAKIVQLSDDDRRRLASLENAMSNLFGKLTEVCEKLARGEERFESHARRIAIIEEGRSKCSEHTVDMVQLKGQVAALLRERDGRTKVLQGATAQVVALVAAGLLGAAVVGLVMSVKQTPPAGHHAPAP